MPRSAAAAPPKPPPSPAGEQPPRAVVLAVAAASSRRRRVRVEEGKLGRPLPAVAGHRRVAAADDRVATAAQARRRPSSVVVRRVGEYRWVRLVVLYVFMSSNSAAGRSISGEVAILVRPWVMSA